MKAARANRIRTIDLGHEQLMILDDGRGERVRVLHGATWLTQEGEAGDTVLRPGADRGLRDGRTLIEALEPTRLQILSGPGSGRRRAEPLWRHVQRWVSRLQFGPPTPEAGG
jgi:hypothetical protein